MEGRALLAVLLCLFGLQQTEVCGHVIVESFQENEVWSEANEHVEALQPVGVPPLQSRIYQFVSHIGFHMALNLVNKQVEWTAQYLSGEVVSAFAFALIFVFTVSTAAHLECMDHWCTSSTWYTSS